MAAVFFNLSVFRIPFCFSLLSLEKYRLSMLMIISMLLDFYLLSFSPADM